MTKEIKVMIPGKEVFALAVILEGLMEKKIKDLAAQRRIIVMTGKSALVKIVISRRNMIVEKEDLGPERNLSSRGAKIENK